MKTIHIVTALANIHSPTPLDVPAGLPSGLLWDILNWKGWESNHQPSNLCTSNYSILVFHLSYWKLIL